ncbi:MAG TPA: TolC family protein [Xanthomonadales bacterium]|nr:TolC family protein [Xanthomonadales bacterium]
MKRRHAGPLVAVLLAACASTPRERADDELARAIAARQGSTIATTAEERAARDADVAARLAKPIAIDDAVAIALARNPRVAAQLADLGIAQAELLEASRPSNPSLTLSALDSNRAGERTKLGISVVQSFADLVLLKSRTAVARGELDASVQHSANEVLASIADSARAWLAAAGAQQVAEMRALAAESAAVSADLAQRYHDAGNVPALFLAEHRAAAVEASLAADQAKLDALRTSHALAEAMGLDAAAQFALAAGLPLPVADEDQLDALLERAATRPDLAAARRRTEVLAGSLGVTRKFRWLGRFEVGIEGERETDGAELVGPSVAVELPLFHRNEAALARAEARVDRAEADALALETSIAHAVRAGHAAVAAAATRVARLRDELLPLREQVLARTQERVNFMLDDPFALLRAKREQVDAYQQYLEALRDYWLARVELAAAIGAALPSSARIGEERAAPPATEEPQEDHSHHHEHDGGEPTP